jgi:hypothetical protein
VLSDEDCATAYRRARGNDGERFSAARMVCGIDPDGEAPLSSGCNGDSGGPFFAGTAEAPQLLGVVSFGGLKCGADHLPSVFTEVARYRAFLTDPAPTWAPTTTEVPKVTGPRRPGGRLRCARPAFAAPAARTTVLWRRNGRITVIGRHSTFVVRRGDRGKQLICTVEAENDGGRSVSPPALVRISR